MKISKRAKKTMPESWQKLFEESTEKHWSKYFEDGGFECCAYEPEWDGRRVVQIAERRYRGAGSGYFREQTKEYYGKLLGKSSFVIFKAYVTGSPLHGGVYIWDVGDMIRAGYTKKEDLVSRGVNLYHEIPLEKCVKMMDLWEIPKFYSGSKLFKCAAWQYQDMITENIRTGKCDYDGVKTWEDLPDFCFWKWMEADGTIIKGREQKFNDFVAKTRADARYIPVKS